MDAESGKLTVTVISVQARNPNRVNVFVDGTYRLSLDVYQATDLGVKVGRQYSEAELVALEDESSFGKLYGRALEYTMMRPHSAREVRDYLWRKTRPKKVLKHISSREGSTFTKRGVGNGQEGGKREVVERPGVSQAIADRVYKRLEEKGYIDDAKFAVWWVENRNIQKGASRKKMYNELRAKGISTDIIEQTMQKSTRDEKSELQKVIAKKQGRYSDERKFIQYLQRQGFAYDDIRRELDYVEEEYEY